MDYFNKTVAEVCQVLDVDAKVGLSEFESNKRRKKHSNVIATKKRKNIVWLILMQMTDFMTVVLLFAAAISYLTGVIKGNAEIFEPLLIVGIVVLNAVMGAFQQRKAENAIDELNKMASPHSNVLRDGVWKNIATSELTIGDIVRVTSGDKIGADMRIIEANGLEVDESSLTGESESVGKTSEKIGENTAINDRKNMLYSGTSVMQGSGVAVVCAVGSESQIGKIAEFISTEEDAKTPLEKRLDELAKTLGICALFICAVIFVFGVMRRIDPLSMFVTAVSLAVAAIPEGLPATVTVMLALGVLRMAKKNAIVKRLSAVETLGSATVICTDKTGTLTKNEMSVKTVVADDDGEFTTMLGLASLPMQNATDRAISKWCNFNASGWVAAEEIPFSSDRKMMFARYVKNGESVCVTKGAAEYVLKICNLTDFEREKIISETNRLSEEGLRVVAVACCDSDKLETENYTYCGLVGIYDAPREEAKQAVLDCKNAGISVVMITGDHPKTALKIAEEVGICNDKRVITGAELAMMSDSELAAAVKKAKVFARVTPEDKLRIVTAFQRGGAVVAMTGDGVNDAPALKRADIGCAMGKNGTEVAKEAADIVLADDNFATVATAVFEGRKIFANIKKSVLFLLSSNIGELLCVFLSIMFGLSPLTAAQLLWINFITDSLPAIALGMEDSKSVQIGGKLLDRASWVTILSEGAMIGANSILAYVLGNVITHNVACAKTMAFTVLGLSQLVHAFNLRSKKSVLNSRIFSNKFLTLSLVLGVGLTALIITIPQTAVLFGACRLNGLCWRVVAVLSLLPLAVVELAKRIEGKNS